MKILDEGLMVGEENIPWERVATLRLLNKKLAILFKDGKIKEFELQRFHPSLIDLAFRSFESYLRSHPTKR